MSSNSSGPGGGNGPPTTAGNHSATSDTRLASIKKTTNSSSSAKSDTSLTGIQNTPGSSSVTSATSLASAQQTPLPPRSSSAPKDTRLASATNTRRSNLPVPRKNNNKQNRGRGDPVNPALNTTNRVKEETRQSSTPDAVMTDAPIPSNTPWVPVGSATAATANAAGSIRGLNYPVPSAVEKESRREKDEFMKKGLTRPTIQRQANVTNQFPSSNGNNKGDPIPNTSLNSLTFRLKNATLKPAFPDATMADAPTPTTSTWYHASNTRKNAQRYNSRGRIQKQYNSRPSFEEAKAKKAALTKMFHESLST